MPTEEVPPTQDGGCDLRDRPDATDEPVRSSPDPGLRLIEIAPVFVAIVPFVVAAIRAAAGSWVPIRDDAYFTARSLDVATSNHPLLGAWSAGSLDVRKPVNNLGPMQLDLLAPFTRFTPMGGTAIGVACVHIAAIVTIAWLIHRLAGRRYVLPAMAAVAILAWSLGSEMLITPQQHQFLLFSYLCVLVAAWGVTWGDRWALVPAVVFGSLAAQTHLSYPILLAALGVPMIVGQILAARRDGGRDGGRPDRSSVTPFIVSGAIVVVLWIQTAIDQFAVSGNFVDVLTSGGEASATPSRSTAVRIVAEVLAGPARFLRPGYGEFDPERSIGNNLQVAVLVVVFVLLVVGLGVAAAGSHRRAAAGLSIAVVTLAAGVVDATMLPITEGFGLLASNYRWLWAIGAFLLLGSFCLLVRVGPRLSQRHGAAAVSGCLAVILVLATVANLSRSVQVPNPELYLRDQDSTQELLRQLHDVPIEGPVVIDQDSMYLGHPYTYPILASLVRRGIDYRFDSELQARRFGDARVSDGTESQRLVMSFGADADLIRDEFDTVVYVPGSPSVALTLATGPEIS
ncbi:hypothetical protein [Ilumatobacter sp.]|uniref:hypothetical protein n=1 Tax=Ilumatobacter sp. TaxID=1967498 RepID=UPI003C5457E9